MIANSAELSYFTIDCLRCQHFRSFYVSTNVPVKYHRVVVVTFLCWAFFTEQYQHRHSSESKGTHHLSIFPQSGSRNGNYIPK